MMIKPKSINAIYNLATMYMYTAQVQGAQVIGIVWAVYTSTLFAVYTICGCVLVLHTSALLRNAECSLELVQLFVGANEDLNSAHFRLL